MNNGGVCGYLGEENLSEEDAMQEFIFLGLRLTEGISEAVFKDCFGRDLRDVYGKILDKNISDGLLYKTEKGYALTDRGIDLSNYVFAQF